jgi:hypothetical protein
MLAEIYGPQFVDSYGDAPTLMWITAVAGLSDEQLQRGFSRLIEEARKWPPNLTEFAGACRRHEPVRYLGVPLTEPQLKNLLPSPEQQAPVSTRDFYLAKMRRTLRVPPTERDAAASTLEAAEAQCRCNEIPEGELCVACRDWESRMLAIAQGRAV